MIRPHVRPALLRLPLPILLLLLLPAILEPTRAQQSASFKLEEHAFNSGGHPADGMTLASASFRLSLDALGEGISAVGLSSPARRMDSCFVATYSPAAEVENLRFTNGVTLAWDADRAAGRYNLYRDLLSALSGLGYGACLQSAIFGPSATDGTSPGSGQGYFYLVTAENRLREEATKGYDSSGVEHANATPCP